MVICCGGCVQGEAARLDRAARDLGVVAAVQVPALDARCRAVFRSGVREGDRLDVALLKTDAALTAANARIRSCADWYDESRAGLSAK